MKIICSFHPSSSVLGSVKCRLGSGDLEYLVVAKLDRLEVFSLRSHGLQKECVLPVLGKICSVKTIPISVRRNVVHSHRVLISYVGSPKTLNQGLLLC